MKTLLFELDHSKQNQLLLKLVILINISFISYILSYIISCYLIILDINYLSIIHLDFTPSFHYTIITTSFNHNLVNHIVITATIDSTPTTSSVEMVHILL
jgi:hypothetical protein